MDFVTICRAIYDYEPENEDELQIVEDQLLYIIDNKDKDWWTAKHAPNNTSEDLKVGFVPAAYVEEVDPITIAKAISDYEPQAEDELGFAENDTLYIYQNLDENWCLAKKENSFGFVPITYLDASPYDEQQDLNKQDDKFVKQEEFEEKILSDQTKDKYTTNNSEFEEISHKKKPDVSSMKYYKVMMLDKKKKKKASLGIDREYLFYANEEEKLPVKQFKINMLKSCTINDKKIKVEIQDEDIFQQYQFVCKTKSDANNIYNSLKLYSAENTKFEEKKSKKDNTKKGKNIKITRIDNNTPYHSQHNNDNLDTNYIESSHVPPPVPEKDIYSNIKPAKDLEKYPLALVLYDFEPENNDELGVQVNEKIYVVDKSDVDWWKCQVLYDNNSVLEGLVPASFLKVLDNEEMQAEAEIFSNKSKLSKKVPFEDQTSNDTHNNIIEDKLIKQIIDEENREWIDSSGKFKVQAKFMNYYNNEVELLKTNNLTIKVPIERMSEKDVSYVSDKMGIDLKKEIRYIKDKKQRIKRLREFLTKCEIESEYNISKYCEAFEQENITSSLIKDMNKDDLKILGIKEGDCIKIIKYANYLKQKENKNTSEKYEDPQRKQIEEDEKLAIKLQEEENKLLWKSFKVEQKEPPKPYELKLTGSSSAQMKNNEMLKEIDPNKFQGKVKEPSEIKDKSNLMLNNIAVGINEQMKKEPPLVNIFANPAKLPAPLVPLPDSNSNSDLINFIPTRRIYQNKPRNNTNTSKITQTNYSLNDTTTSYKNFFEDFAPKTKQDNNFKQVDTRPYEEASTSLVSKNDINFDLHNNERININHNYENTFQDFVVVEPDDASDHNESSVTNRDKTYKPEIITKSSNKLRENNNNNFLSIMDKDNNKDHLKDTNKNQFNYIRENQNINENDMLGSSMRQLTLSNNTYNQKNPTNNPDSFKNYISQFTPSSSTNNYQSIQQSELRSERKDIDSYSFKRGYKEELINNNDIEMKHEYNSYNQDKKNTQISSFQNQYSRMGNTTTYQKNSNYYYSTNDSSNNDFGSYSNAKISNFNSNNTSSHYKDNDKRQEMPQPSTNNNFYNFGQNDKESRIHDIYHPTNNFNTEYPDVHSISDSINKTSYNTYENNNDINIDSKFPSIQTFDRYPHSNLNNNGQYSSYSDNKFVPDSRITSLTPTNFYQNYPNNSSTRPDYNMSSNSLNKFDNHFNNPITSQGFVDSYSNPYTYQSRNPTDNSNNIAPYSYRMTESTSYSYTVRDKPKQRTFLNNSGYNPTPYIDNDYTHAPRPNTNFNSNINYSGLGRNKENTYQNEHNSNYDKKDYYDSNMPHSKDYYQSNKKFYGPSDGNNNGNYY